MSITLRNYQERAVRELYAYLRTRSGNPCVVIPTGGGKTAIIATICRDAVEQWSGRVLVVAHVKELLEQSAATLRVMCPGVEIGLYSAGLGSRQGSQSVVVAGVQSVYDRAAELGRFDLLVIDEAHLISENAEGRYRTLIAGLLEINPDLRIVGLTATPYRTGSGPIVGKDGILHDVCYEISVQELIARGFLSRLTSKAGQAEADTSGVKVERGEFVEREAVLAFANVIEPAVDEIVAKAADRRAVLVFCQSIEHAQSVANLLRVHTDGVAEIYGDTPADDRRDSIAAFREGRIKYLVNVNVLTTGFDAPNVDCVVLLRATVSPGLYYQMVGRGFRLCEGKANCLVLDFGGNIQRHGPVDAVRPKVKGKTQSVTGRTCPACREVVPPYADKCHVCGHEFTAEEREIKHEAKAAERSPTSDGDDYEEIREVSSVTYKVHKKKGADDAWPKTMRVTYMLAKPVQFVSEWVCVEHQGFARTKAEKWWAARSESQCPATAEAAVEIAEGGELLKPTELKLTYKAGSEYPEITGCTLPKLEDVVSQPVAEMTDEQAVAWMNDIPW